jgi:hypothetical protein
MDYSIESSNNNSSAISGSFLTIEQSNKITKAVSFIPVKGMLYDWEGYFIGQIGLTDSQNDTLRQKVRKSQKTFPLLTSKWDELRSGSDEDFLAYVRNHSNQFHNLHQNNILLALVTEAGKKAGLLIVNLTKVVENAKGERVTD